MEFERHLRELDGRTFEVRALPAKMGRRALTRLAKRLGPALSEAFAGRDLAGVEDLGLLDLDVGALVKTLAQDLTEEDVEFFCDLFDDYTSAEMVPGSGQLQPLSKGSNFDLLFASRYGTMTKWLWFCLEVNFGGFFGGRGPSAGAGAPPAKPTR